MPNHSQTKKRDISSDTQSQKNTESRTLSDSEIELLRAQKRKLVEEAIKRNSK